MYEPLRSYNFKGEIFAWKQKCWFCKHFCLALLIIFILVAFSFLVWNTTNHDLNWNWTSIKMSNFYFISEACFPACGNCLGPSWLCGSPQAARIRHWTRPSLLAASAWQHWTRPSVQAASALQHWTRPFLLTARIRHWTRPSLLAAALCLCGKLLAAAWTGTWTTIR